MELPDTSGEGRVCWSGKEDVELCEIIVVRRAWGEEVVGR